MASELAPSVLSSSHSLSQRVINRPLSTEAAKCRWSTGGAPAVTGGTSGVRDRDGNQWDGQLSVPGTVRRSAPSHSVRWNAPRSCDACSGGSAPRTSSSRRPAPFGAAPSPTGSPILSGPPACPPGTSATTRPPAARTPPTWSSAARRRRRGAALCRPALLDGAAQPLQAEAGGRVLLVDPLARGVLRGRGADLQAGWPRHELQAGEAAARRSCGWSSPLMLQEKAKEVEAPACGRAAAWACGVMYEQVKRRFERCRMTPVRPP